MAHRFVFSRNLIECFLSLDSSFGVSSGILIWLIIIRRKSQKLLVANFQRHPLGGTMLARVLITAMVGCVSMPARAWGMVLLLLLSSLPLRSSALVV